ncbi:MAG: DNA polymerase II [Planctomycetota bacterium]|nr:DNA polymerase II [Planctomycetota bacterium]
MPGEPGFLLHVYPRLREGRTLMCGIGRLRNGETFAFLDDRYEPCFHIREADRETVDVEAAGFGARLEASAWTTMDGAPVLRAAAPRAPDLRKFADRLGALKARTYEADVPPARAYLLERDLRGGVSIEGPWRKGRGLARVYENPLLEPAEVEPVLRALAFDLETTPDASEVLAFSLASVSGYAAAIEEVHLRGAPLARDPPGALLYPRERELLEAFAGRVRALDPDVLTGWNVIDFDLAVLQRRFKACGLPFRLGRTAEASYVRPGRGWGGSQAVLHGRQALDALHLVRALPARFEDYRLGTVALARLGRGKTLEAEEDAGLPEQIERAWRENRAAFCAYALEDARLVRDILLREKLLDLTARRSVLTGQPLDRAWGSVAAFDFLYIRELHRRGIVAPTLGVDQPGQAGAPGGLVMPPVVGLHRGVFVFDFKSLYPSLMRTFNIDPLAHARARGLPKAGIVEAPNGAAFAREPGILPGLLEAFFRSREEAKARGDETASFAYKIVMNSFYGVLGSGGCRFSSPPLAGAITSFGHYMLKFTRQLIEARGGRVLYGDTDSIFAEAGLAPEAGAGEALAAGRELCAWVNARLGEHVRERWHLSSCLELEFEKYYHRFLLPPGRTLGERGRAKGYAGLRLDEHGAEVEIVGMEAVRRDWTDMAHELQRELLALLFADRPGAEIEARVAGRVAEVRAGRWDEKLVYRKALRKGLEGYTRASPPHVRAARLLDRPRGVIRYVMTRDGPQPAGRAGAPLDYEHYIKKQIAPLVETLAQVYAFDAEAALTGQRSLFGSS